MKLTKSLLAHAVKHFGLDAGLVEDAEGNREAIVKCVNSAMSEGLVTFDELTKLTNDEPLQSKGEKAIAEAVAAAMAPVVDALKGLSKPAEVTPQAEPAPGPGEKAYTGAAAAPEATATPEVKVLGMKDKFDSTKRFLNAGGVVQEKAVSIPSLSGQGQRSFEGFSELDRAVAGATLKYLYHRAQVAGQGLVPKSMEMTELDWNLMKYAANEMAWAGPIGMKGSDDENADYGWAKNSMLNDIQTKVVLDDNTSGGLEAVPIVFDDLAIITPLLTSELLPLVDMRVTTRRRVEGFRLANPDMYWTEEGTAPTEFNTDGFIGEFNTNIHPCVGWMELGMDFLADSPVAIADLIISRYAEKGRVMLENAIATGSGSGEPLGLTNTASPTVVPAATATQWSVADVEKLLFAIPKEYRQVSGKSQVYVSNETTYSRLKGLPVGTDDNRRVFGMNHEDFQILGHGCKINHGITNATLMSACMDKYIMYRRAGFDVRRVTEDSDLAKKNLEMLVVRMRYGGQFSDSSALAVMTDGAA